MKATSRTPIPRRRVRKGLRTTLVAVAAVLVLGASVSAYYVFDLLGLAERTDVDITDDVTIPPGSLDHISDLPTEPVVTDEPTDGPLPTIDFGVSVTPGATGAPRRWGSGRCRVYVVPSIPIRRVEQKDPLVLNLLIYGVDARSANTLASRTDTMMIATIDKRHGAIKLTSLMRDTQVDIEGRSLPNKLNTPYVYGGIGLFLNTVNQTFDLDIQKFVMIDFWSAEDVIEMAGGIDADILDKEVYWLNKSIAEANNLFANISVPAPYVTGSGMQHLNGRQAVAYGRIRKADSDHQRTARQRYIATQLLAAFWKADAAQKDATLRSAFSAVNTNMTSVEMLDIAFGGVVASRSPILQYKVPATGLYVTDPDTYNLVMDLPRQRAALHAFIWGSAPANPTATPPPATPTPTPEATPTEPAASPTEIPSPTDGTPTS